MTNSMDGLTVQFRGKSYHVPFEPSSTTSSALADALQQAVPGLAMETLKVLVARPKARSMQLLQQPSLLLADAGITPGSKLVLLGSFTSELQAVQANKQAEASLRLPDFDHETSRLAQRRNRSNRRAADPNDGPAGEHCFGSFQVLPLPTGHPPGAPSPSAALSLLHRIATDPAIVHVMKQHGWQVGLLSEMPPEGKVGISAVCLLGYNVNKGQEISLRLRTDDYQGFRKYLRIRETLVHELAHMVHSEHDNDFKALNSQLLKEVSAHEAASTGGRTLAGAGVFDDDWLGQQQEHTAAAVAQGRTIGGTVAAAGAAREAAAAAALARYQQQQQQTRGQAAAASVGAGAASSPVETAGSGPIPAQVMDQIMQDADQASAAEAGGTTAAKAGPVYDDDALSDDPATAAAEQEMRRLGSMNEPEQPQEQQHLQQQPQQEQQLPLHIEAMPQELSQTTQRLTCSLPAVKQSSHQHHQWQEQPASKCENQQQGDVSSPQQGAAVVSAGQDTQMHDNTDAAALVDDVVAQKLQRASRLLQQLQQQAGDSSQQAVQAVESVLSSITQHPNEEKYRRLRCSNAAFHRRMGQYSAAVQLLLLAGFTEKQLVWNEAGRPEAVLLYVRGDPGLLWLILSVVRDFQQHGQESC